MKVVAVIPALDEAGTISAVVRTLPRDLISRIIVVDNGSRDTTARVARDAGAEVVAEARRGYGRACMAGVAAAPEADVYLFLDGDGSDLAEEAGRVLAPVLAGGADLVLGSRMLLPSARRALPPAAQLGNRLAARLIGLVDGVCVTDLAPFKAVRADTLRSLRPHDTTYGWTVELVASAAHRRLRIVEVPVRYRSRLAGKSKVSGTVRGTARASLCILWTLARVHLHRHAVARCSSEG